MESEVWTRYTTWLVLIPVVFFLWKPKSSVKKSLAFIHATSNAYLTFLFLSTTSVTGEFLHLLGRFPVVYSCSFCSMCNFWLLNLLANRSLEVDIIMYIHLIIF